MRPKQMLKNISVEERYVHPVPASARSSSNMLIAIQQLDDPIAWQWDHDMSGQVVQ